MPSAVSTAMLYSAPGVWSAKRKSQVGLLFASCAGGPGWPAVTASVVCWAGVSREHGLTPASDTSCGRGGSVIVPAPLVGTW